MPPNFDPLKSFTQARIGLSRAGISLSTEEILKFKWAHAQARDAIHQDWNFGELQKKLKTQAHIARSQVNSRLIYLKRPDLGKLLCPESAAELQKLAPVQIVWVISDGLSALAIEKHFLSFWEALKDWREKFKYQVVLAPFSRVAIGDEIGHRLSADISIVLIGERPGLSSADSLGAYLTYSPKPGTMDSARNCISNIRPPNGLSYSQASKILFYLVKESLNLKLSGVGLKESSDLLNNS